MQVSVDLGSADGAGFHFPGIELQSFFIALQHLAGSQHGLRIRLVAGFAQLFGDTLQVDRRPSQVRCNALQVALKFVFVFIEPHSIS